MSTLDFSDSPRPSIRVTAPGRVNLIGDHTDYMGGTALPMTVHMATVIEARRGGNRLRLRSDVETEPLDIELPVVDPAIVTPRWGRYVAGVASAASSTQGFTGSATCDIPIGAGLSSSAALEVATALALGVEGSPLELAALCQRAEHEATGVPSGLMDQLVILASEPASALLIDFSSMQFSPVAIADSFAFWVVDSTQKRSLDASQYGNRRKECEEAEAVLHKGLRDCTRDDAEALDDQILMRRARHFVTECERVADFVDAMEQGDIAEAGRLMNESHASLRDDFEVSTGVLDSLVTELNGIRGVHGARVTGAGFGGCVVVLAEAGAEVPGWRVRPAGPARVESA